MIDDNSNLNQERTNNIKKASSGTLAVRNSMSNNRDPATQDNNEMYENTNNLELPNTIQYNNLGRSQ